MNTDLHRFDVIFFVHDLIALHVERDTLIRVLNHKDFNDYDKYKLPESVDERCYLCAVMELALRESHDPDELVLQKYQEKVAMELFGRVNAWIEVELERLFSCRVPQVL